MLDYASDATPYRNVRYAIPDPSLVKCNLALVCLWRNQEEILELHALGCSTWRKLNAFHLPEHERHGVSKLHASKMDANA